MISKAIQLFTHLRLQVLKYIFLSVFGYLYVIVCMYFLVDMLNMPAQIAYALTYISAYFFDYLANLKYIFNKENSNKTVIRYILYLIVSFLVNNLIYSLLIYLNINYLLSAIIVILLLFPARFFALKYVVYK